MDDKILKAAFKASKKKELKKLAEKNNISYGYLRKTLSLIRHRKEEGRSKSGKLRCPSCYLAMKRAHVKTDGKVEHVPYWWCSKCKRGEVEEEDEELEEEEDENEENDADKTDKKEPEGKNDDP
ncbi:MAG: hypothetical protein ACTSRU_05465 [Candidatus Hodarchaeales archaeon]